MSGHSKWSSIKHQKGATDAKRGKLFTKLGHAVSVAARESGGDAAMNPRLTLAIDMAKKANMPKENIERAVKRGTGELGGAAVESVIYEGYGPGGTAILIQGLTDNRNRTVADIRTALTKNGGKLAEGGSVAYLFTLKGALTALKNSLSNEELEMAIIDSGAEDYELLGERATILTSPRDLQPVKERLEAAGLNITSAEQKFEPSQTVEITDEKTAAQIIRLMESIEELDDVTEVVSNFDIQNELLAKIAP